jgi:uncharacterized membrane protein
MKTREKIYPSVQDQGEMKKFRKRMITAGLLIGIGMGGLLDGIVLHQILQWHNMLSSVLPPDTLDAMKINMLWDGFFHAFVFLAVAAGIFLLWKTAEGNIRFPGIFMLTGLLLLGWGIFNLVEGIVNHQILQIHHVRYINDIPGGEPDLLWGYGFLLLGGIGLILTGWLMIRKALK